VDQVLSGTRPTSSGSSAVRRTSPTTAWITRWKQGKGDKTALLWEGDEPSDTKEYTYSELLAEVQKFANVLKGLGVQKGDPVSIYLPMIPEVAIAMLACARIGAPHSVVFSAFSPGSLRDRMNDCEAKVLVTANQGPQGRQGRQAQGRTPTRR
jgi:acetyl-CoA synthetase